MDSKESMVQLSTNPRKDASILSILFYLWVNPLMRKGCKKQLQQTDLYQVLDEDCSRVLGDKLDEALNKELDKCINSKGTQKNTSKSLKPKLLNLLIRTFGSYLIVPGILVFVESCGVLVIQTWFMEELMTYFKDENLSTLIALIYVMGIVLMTACYNILHHQYFYKLQIIGMRLRVAFCSVIYRKALRLSNESVSKYTIGKAVNLLTNDVSRFDNCLIFIHHLWAAPVQFVIVLYLTWKLVGNITFIGLATVVTFMVMQPWFTRKFYILRGETAKKTDLRISMIGEILNGIKVIKMYCWEGFFANLIEKLRKEEIEMIHKNYYLQAFNYSAYLCFVRIVLTFILMIWVVHQEIVTPEIAFLILSWYNVIKVTWIKFFTKELELGSQAIKSINRIETFLVLEESNQTQEPNYLTNKGNGIVNLDDIKTLHYNMGSDACIIARNVFAKWNANDSFYAVENLTFEIEKGQSYGICGSVGSGKSAVLKTLLEDLALVSGEISLNGRVSYASQDPWIFDGTIRQNILFGKELDRDRYDNIIRISCMGPDIASFNCGNNEFVGDRGTSLSGGQKARLNLARSLYCDGDIFLLDDPLSSVDANVAKDIFQKCIKEHLKDKIVILATHQLHLLKEVDKIIVMHQGTASEFGTYDELYSNPHGRLSFLLKDSSEKAPFGDEANLARELFTLDVGAKHSQCERDIDKRELTSSVTKAYNKTNGYFDNTGNGNLSHDSSSYNLDRKMESTFLISNNCTNTGIKSIKMWTKLIANILSSQKVSSNTNSNEYGSVSQIDRSRKEESKVGSVSLDLYWKYIKAGSSPVGIATLIVSTLVSHGLYRFADAWLGIWTNKDVTGRLRELSLSLHSSNDSGEWSKPQVAGLKEEEYNNINYFYLTVYGSSVLTMIFSTFYMRYSFFRICNTSSYNLHNNMFERILSAPIQFFNDNPTGRILNRFSLDIGRIDEMLPNSKAAVCEIFLETLGVISIVVYKNWWMVGPTVFMAAFFYYLRKYYLASSIAIKRMEAAAKSPLVSQLASSLSGLTTIRCCAAENKLIQEFDHLQDLHTSAWCCYLSTSRFLAVYCDWMSFVYLCFCAFPFVIPGRESAEPSDVGLVISTCLTLVGTLQYGLRESAQMENLMTSVERVMEYAEIKTEQEYEECPRFTDISTSILPSDKKNSLECGVIEFKNVFLRYIESHGYVLKNVCFMTRKGEKVGVVGRTGAGKSSLITALYRLVEPEGEILIDGFSIKQMKLKNLRNLMSIIPQDPVIFPGTLRMNLDPFDSCSDNEIWNALGSSNLTAYVSTLQDGLNHKFAVGGDNLSIGQRQLFCLARALLRKTKILILDEATANVDVSTDEVIQKIIRKEFNNSTIITIAHRLHTIMDYDRILVLHEGRIVEYDSPEILMKDKSTLFYSMLQNSGLIPSSESR